MSTTYRVNNLFNNKDVILSKEDIFKIAEYAIENDIIRIDIGVPNSKSMFEIKDDGIFYICSEKVKEAVDDPSLFGPRSETLPNENKNVIDGSTYEGDDVPLDLPTFRS